MTNKDAIKFLQQLYPNGGHCWLDEQRIEAIGMAINVLQEEPVSEDLEEAIDTYLKSYWGSEKEKQEWPFLKKMVIYFAKWQKQQMMAKAIDGVVTFDYYDSGDKTYGCVAHDSFCLEDFGLKDRDEVKVIVIKED